MRSFIALPLPPDLLDDVVALQQAMAPLMTGRLVPRQNLHLTLAFLGDIDESQTRRAMDAMEAAVAQLAAPVLLEPECLGSFKRGRDDMFWLGLRRGPAVMGLQADLEARLRQGGLHLEKRSFLPHVTLARRARFTGAELGALPLPLPDRAQEVTLFRSELLPDGARYKEAFSVALP